MPRKGELERLRAIREQYERKGKSRKEADRIARATVYGPKNNNGKKK